MDRRTQQSLVPGAPGIIDLGGNNYLVSQPTDEDLETIGLFIRKQLKANGLALPQGDADYGELMADELCTVAGVRFLAWVLLRKQQKVGPEELEEEIHEYSYHSIFLALTRASGMTDLGNSDGRSG